MATLFLKNLIPMHKKKSTDRLFFNKYKYSISINEPRCSVLRGLFSNDVDTVPDTISKRLGWQPDINYGGSWAIPRPYLNDQLTLADREQRLCRLYSLIKNQAGDFKFSTTRNWCYVYTNDITQVDKLVAQDFNVKVVHEASIDRPFDSVHGTGDYTRRTYFKERLISQEAKKSLAAYLTSQQGINLGPSFKSWLNSAGVRHYNLVARHYYFDHNNDAISQMLELITPGLIRKTIQILTK